MARRRWLVVFVMVVLAVALSPSHAALGSAERSALAAVPTIVADTTPTVVTDVGVPATDAAAAACLHDVTCAGAAAGAVLMAAFVLAVASDPSRARTHGVVLAVEPVATTGRRTVGQLFRPPRSQV